MNRKVVCRIAKQRCKGCRLCVEVCPKQNLRLSAHFNKLGYHYVEFADDGCTGCRRCAVICPDACIELYLDDAVPEKAENKKA